MSAATPIKATFSDFKIIRGRKVAQLCFEVPLESADAALSALGGLPRPDAEKWYGIVALDLKAASESEKPRKPFETLPAPQQAAIRCQDRDFQRFMKATDADAAASKVRLRCGVESRSELATNEDAAQKWRALDTEYFRDSRGIR